MKKAFKAALPRTIPVMAGYIFLGIAFGLLMSNSGYGILWALAMSVFIYAGTAQFLGVSLLAAGASLPSVALLTFILNFRHFFYGLSMLSKYKDTGKVKPYLIFGLTDETYAILAGGLVPQDVDETKYYFAVTLLDQIYWVLGSVLGNAFGAIITIDLTGIDFAMTALFAILVVENWKAHSRHLPAMVGFLISIVCLIIFGVNNYLIPALVGITLVLLFWGDRRKFELQEGE